MDVVNNMSRHARYKKQLAPNPLSANLVTEDPGTGSNQQQDDQRQAEPIYSVDDWVEWVQGPEGQQVIQNGYELQMIPAIQNTLLAVMKRKRRSGQKGTDHRSKGGDKGKGNGGKGGKGGKGKGGFQPRPFNGKCHTS